VIRCGHALTVRVRSCWTLQSVSQTVLTYTMAAIQLNLQQAHRSFFIVAQHSSVSMNEVPSRYAQLPTRMELLRAKPSGVV
jgi:hypothetical protein